MIQQPLPWWGRAATISLCLVAVAALTFGVVAYADLRGDVDGDGELTPVDAALILQDVAGLDAGAQGGDVWAIWPERITIDRSGCGAISGYCTSAEGSAVRRTNEIVMRPGAGWRTLVHEVCHFWQFQHEDAEGVYRWEDTSAWQSYELAASLDSGPGDLVVASPVESFAIRCAYWFTNPTFLMSFAPNTYAWFEETFP